jgi:hypothetical protein
LSFGKNIAARLKTSREDGSLDHDLAIYGGSTFFLESKHLIVGPVGLFKTSSLPAWSAGKGRCGIGR